MEVTAVEPVLVRRNRLPEEDSSEVRVPRFHCFVFVETDTDITGIGEATAPGTERGVAGVVQDLGRQIVGRDPQNVEGLWDRIYNAYAWNWGPVAMTALSGIEMALWDIVGKFHDMRVCDLFGGPQTERLKVYANGVIPSDGEPDEAADAAADVAARGFGAVKFIPSYDRGERAWLTKRAKEATPQRMAAVRNAVGDDFEIAVEAHGVFAPSQAVKVAELVAPYDPLFFEEPVPPENADALRRIHDEIDIPLATGERLLTTFDYRELFQHPVPADIVQPDVNNCGGISQLRKIAAMAYTEYIPVAPHNSRGPIATAAVAHACSTIPNFLILEYFPDLPPWRQELIHGTERVEDGFYYLPDSPGLGVELDRDALVEYGYVEFDRDETVYSAGYRDLWS